MRILLLLAAWLFLLCLPVQSMTPEEEKLLFQTLGEIKGELKQIRHEISLLNKRIDDTNKRIDDLREDMNRRFEQVDKRFEQVDRRFEDLKRYAGWFILGFFGLIATFVALLIWDRRTAVRSALKEMDRDYRLSQLVRLLDVLRERAKTDKELASIMRHLGLL